MHLLRLPFSLLLLLAGAGAACAQVTVQPVDGAVTAVSASYGAEAVAADGKLLVASYVQAADGSWGSALQRFAPDGTADSAFDASGLHSRQIASVTALPDGAALVLGQFGPDPNGAVDAGSDDDAVLAPDPQVLLRLKPDGTINPAFASVTAPVDWVDSVYPLDGGATLVGGYVTAAGAGNNDDPVSTYHLLRYRADGHADLSFQASFPAGASLVDLKVQPDGKLLVALASGDDVPVASLVRLNADGSRDAAFQPLLPAGMEIDALALRADGSAVVATSPEADDGGADVGTLLRFNPDGSTDPAFTVELPGTVDALYALDGGAVLAIGDFTAADGTDHYGLELVTDNGHAVAVLDPASPDSLEDAAPAPGGGFFAGLNGVAPDGTGQAVVEAFDAAGQLVSRTIAGAGVSLASLLARPDGGVYANLAAFPIPVYETLNGGFAPPPSPGASTVRKVPTVTISAVRAEAYAGSSRKAKFLLTRTGDTSQDLRVVYSIKGSAIGGRDYMPLHGVRVIKAGRSSERIRVRPTGARYGRVQAGRASVRLTLLPRRSYSVGTPAAAKVRLLNHRKSAAALP